MPMQYAAIVLGCKNGSFQMKKCDFFPQNIDHGYTLEPPQSMFKSKSKKIMYIPVNPNFTI